MVSTCLRRSSPPNLSVLLPLTIVNVSAKYGLLLFVRKGPPSPTHSTFPLPLPQFSTNMPGVPVVPYVPKLTFGIPISEAKVSLFPQAPPTPQLLIPTWIEL
jgi:hypothetical protein